MEIKRDPVKKRLAKIYLIISQIMLPTLIVERLLRVISWVIINTGYMVVNFVYGLFYKLPYWILKVTTPTEPKKPKHDLKTVLNDVEALVKR